MCFCQNQQTNKQIYNPKLPLQFSTLLSFLITNSTVHSHLIFLNINKNSSFSTVCYFLMYLHYQNLLMYALSYTVFIKISHCCYHKFYPPIYSQIEICSYNFHPGRLTFSGASLYVSISHSNAHRPY
jgi:hypothetical protein